jgi:threonyl-tRNA synthetase
MERFFGVLVEHYAGAFPMWLAPKQVILLTVADRHVEFARELEAILEKRNIRVAADFGNDKLGAKIRGARLMRIPAIAVIGDREVENRGASLRTRQEGDKGFIAMDDFIEWIVKEALEPPV